MPHQMEQFLKMSERPTPPAPMMGELYKETHNLITEWHVRHAELNKGFMQWWQTSDDARSGLRPTRVAVLLGMKLKVETDTSFSFSTASTKGAVYSFDATQPQGMQRWVRALEHHAQYCEQLQEHL